MWMENPLSQVYCLQIFFQKTIIAKKKMYCIEYLK